MLNIYDHRNYAFCMWRKATILLSKKAFSYTFQWGRCDGWMASLANSEDWLLSIFDQQDLCLFFRTSYRSESSHQFGERATTISDGKAQGYACSCFHIKRLTRFPRSTREFIASHKSSWGLLVLHGSSLDFLGDHDNSWEFMTFRDSSCELKRVRDTPCEYILWVIWVYRSSWKFMTWIFWPI